MTISKTTGDMVAIDVAISVKIDLLICFIQNYSVLNLPLENSCVRCLANHRFHQCEYEGRPTSYYHSFQVILSVTYCIM